MSKASDYKQYLKSDHWRDLRTAKLAEQPWCEICGSRQNRHVHHLRYKSLFDCELLDLMTLCENCHADFHVAQENLGWNISCSEEAKSMVIFFRSTPDYAELRGSRPTAIQKKSQKAPYARFKHQVNSLMASYRRRTPLTPSDVREMIVKLHNLIASEEAA